MPRLIKKCCAPSPYSHHLDCGKEFIAYVDHQLYCSRTCANRAHRIKRYTRKEEQQHVFSPPSDNSAPLAIFPLSGEEGLKALGYGIRESAAPEPPKPAPLPDTSAEPKPRKLPTSTEDSPPDFRDYDEGEFTLDPNDDPYKDL